MNNRERFLRTLNFKPVDRLPVIEWAWWWDKTIDRWHGEGLPPELTDCDEIRAYFGLDTIRETWVGPRRATCPPAPGHGLPVVYNREDYLAIKKHLYPDVAFDRELFRRWGEEQKAGETIIWIYMDGYFWFPRGLLGIENHLFAFYDQPDLMNEMNRDLMEFNLRIIDQICEVCVPDIMEIAEDLSYNHGPMLSKELFDEFLAPYYRPVTAKLRERGILPFVDTDGDLTECVSWFEENGVQGVEPLERQAGVDPVYIREKHPNVRMIGGFDKTIMHLGEERMRQEFEHMLPAMRSGGFILSIDHQTPPGVSLEDFRLYLSLLREYCEKAGSG